MMERHGMIAFLRSARRRMAPFAAGLLLASCQSTGGAGPGAAGEVAVADAIYANGKIHTMDAAMPRATAVALRGGRIAAIGTREEVMALAGPATVQYDLGGRLVLPAFGDAHVHPVFGGMAFSRCSLHAGETLADYQRIIADCVAKSPGDDAIYGVGWEDSLFPPNGVPRKEVLDAVSTTRPLIFESVGGHSFWVNSAALALAGIDNDTPDPPNGHIDRDPETGEAVGGLQESAMALAEKFVPKPTEAEIEQAILYVTEHFNALGITAFHDAGVDYGADPNPVIEAYRKLLASGVLTAHVNVALKWDNARGMEQMPALIAALEAAQASGVTARSVKFYVDGVIPQQTAAMIEPYEGSEKRGESHIDPTVLKSAVTALDARGYQAFIHAIGDRAVREGLDAVEAARKANGDSGIPHMITHLNVVDPVDQPRFGALGTIAQFQALWASNYPYMDLTKQAIGPERSRSIYPAGSIMKGGGMLAYGEDWPVDSADPLRGIEVAVSRRTPGDPDAQPLLPGEAVTLEKAIEAYTRNVAISSGRLAETGTLETGKSADLVVIDKDLYAIAPHEISSARVLLTLFRGEPVHGDPGALPEP